MALNGIDLSHHQGDAGLTVNIFNKMPFDFAIMKATQGTWMVDAWCDKYYQAAKKRGKLLGVFHYADGTGSAVEEADYFLKHCSNYIGEAIVVLDWENEALKLGVSWAKKWLDRIYEKTKVHPLIYMSDSVTESYNWASVAKNNGLWIAQYPDNNIVHGYNTDPWRDNDGQGAFPVTAIHQYTSHGRISPWTGNLDLDIAYMSANGWRAYAKGDRSENQNQNSNQNQNQNANQNENVLKAGTKLTVTIDSITPP